MSSVARNKLLLNSSCAAIYKSSEVTSSGGLLVLVDPETSGRVGCEASCLGYQALGRPAITLSKSKVVAATEVNLSAKSFFMGKLYTFIPLISLF